MLFAFLFSQSGINLIIHHYLYVMAIQESLARAPASCAALTTALKNGSIDPEKIRENQTLTPSPFAETGGQKNEPATELYPRRNTHT